MVSSRYGLYRVFTFLREAGKLERVVFKNSVIENSLRGLLNATQKGIKILYSFFVSSSEDVTNF